MNKIFYWVGGLVLLLFSLPIIFNHIHPYAAFVCVFVAVYIIIRIIKKSN